MTKFSATAQAELRAVLEEVGPDWVKSIKENSRRVVEAYARILAQVPMTGTVTRDIAYGTHPRQVLDVYAPAGAAHAPIVVFVHGGGFVDGEKDRTPEVYSNVCRFLCRHGVIGINMEYRLAPDSVFPGGTQDTAAAVTWVRKHIGRFGGDPLKLFLMGHSAGAAHVGHYVYDRRWHGPGDAPIAGLVILSGRVRAENLPENPNRDKVELYYRHSQEHMEQGSLVTHVAAGYVPTMIGVGEYESPLIDLHCVELLHCITRRNRKAPRFFRLPGHNHTSTVAQIDSPDDLVGPQILEFIRTGK